MSFLKVLLLCLTCIICFSAQAQSDHDANKFIGSVVESEPEYIGGLEKFYEYIYKKVPKRDNIKGNYFISFYIEQDGKVSDVKIIRGINTQIDGEIIAAFKEMPDWQPSMIKNQAVRKKKIVQISY